MTRVPKQKRRVPQQWAAGEKALAATKAALAAMAFTEEDGLASRARLRSIMASDNEKEARLACERVRDEMGLTRVIKPAEHAHLHVTLEPWVSELSTQHRRASAKSEHVSPVRIAGALGSAPMPSAQVPKNIDENGWKR